MSDDEWRQRAMSIVRQNQTRNPMPEQAPTMIFDGKSIMAAIRENSRKKAACQRHRFEPHPVKLGEKQTCLECGGTMTLTDMGNYIAGYEAAGKSADDIWPGYRHAVSRSGESSL